MLRASEGENGVNYREGARDGEDSAGLPGEAGSWDLRIKTTLNSPEGGESRRADLEIQTLRESNIPSTKKVPQTGETNLVMVDSVFSVHR